MCRWGVDQAREKGVWVACGVCGVSHEDCHEVRTPPAAYARAQKIPRDKRRGAGLRENKERQQTLWGCVMNTVMGRDRDRGKKRKRERQG